ncbi:hypothetical protein GN244_ATG01192 [Phytophthora infestans]|uniref:Uncharacterized protein n=1 Tax=Phytophthora infestans TaxID=4787 RepID=A0A833WNC2_PHYIN|nr:hypothetical protein GN244_ATG01192 [Phytophthora infestans]KAF4145380.1 hypothetical protein GN958_ATG05410 [Phytophthora infestans]
MALESLMRTKGSRDAAANQHFKIQPLGGDAFYRVYFQYKSGDLVPKVYWRGKYRRILNAWRDLYCHESSLAQ